MYIPGKLVQATSDFDPKIIHVGGHTGEEVDLYKHRVRASGVLWIEANPKLMEELASNISGCRGHMCVNALVSDRDDEEVAFHIANNTHCSSMLEMKEHLAFYPDYRFVETIQLKTVRLDTLMKRVNFGPANVLMMDVQGSEGLVLSGATEVLRNIRVVATEINFQEMYAGVPLAAELDKQLAAHGFTRWATYDTGCGWGDAIYTRES